MALCRMVAFASSTTRLKRRRTCFAGCRRTRGNALAKFQFALVGPGWASRFTPRSRLCKSTTSCATKSLQQSLKALLHLGANEFHSILAHTAKQKGPQLSPEASCFCAEGAFAWTASPSTCRPCRRRRDPPEPQTSARAARQPVLRSSAAGPQSKLRSAAPSASPWSSR